MKSISATQPIIDHTLDDYFQTTSLGSLERASGNNLFGIKHSGGPAPVPINKDNYGLTFFTRPQLNMQGDNIRNLRKFYILLNQNPLSIARWARCILDPRQIYGYNIGETIQSSGITCPLVDNEQAFISVLTNNLQSMSGWPDIAIPTFTSKSGLYNEAYSQVDGISENYEAFDIDATFRNTKGDPVAFLFYIWGMYQSKVFEGTLMPYPDYIMENMIDYNTRIYRLVLDADQIHVKKIAATGASFPINLPTGQFFDFNAERPFNDQNKDITIRFKCMGAQYQDDILVYEFNKTVAIFNPAMEDGSRENNMVKISQDLKLLFNNRGYARISPATYELEWWVPADLFRRKISALSGAKLLTPSQSDATKNI